jgi:hypothetical protein
VFLGQRDHVFERTDGDFLDRFGGGDATEGSAEWASRIDGWPLPPWGMSARPRLAPSHRRRMIPQSAGLTAATGLTSGPLDPPEFWKALSASSGEGRLAAWAIRISAISAAAAGRLDRIGLGNPLEQHLPDRERMAVGAICGIIGAALALGFGQ